MYIIYMQMSQTQGFPKILLEMVKMWRRPCAISAHIFQSHPCYNERLVLESSNIPTTHTKDHQCFLFVGLDTLKGCCDYMNGYYLGGGFKYFKGQLGVPPNSVPMVLIGLI